MNRPGMWLVAAIALGVAMAAGWRVLQIVPSQQLIVVRAKGVSPSDRLRESLFAELQPVALTNCELKRFGEMNDGGYLLCANLLDGVQSGYSYGIAT